jgi:hypothetical protein
LVVLLLLKGLLARILLKSIRRTSQKIGYSIGFIKIPEKSKKRKRSSNMKLKSKHKKVSLSNHNYKPLQAGIMRLSKTSPTGLNISTKIQVEEKNH